MRVKTTMAFLLTMFLLSAFSVGCSCDDDDDDDDDNDDANDDAADDDETDDDATDDDATDDDATDDDATDDDATDDDAADDDATDDDMTDDDATDDDTDNMHTIILDDGDNDYGISGGGTEAGDARVQGFTPGHYPSILRSFTIYVGSEGENFEVRPVIYYATSKEVPTPTPVYVGDAMTLDGWEWNTFDLSAVAALEDHPIESGEFWVGLQSVGAGGIIMLVDEDGTPDDNMWKWDDSAATWHNYATENSYFGVFMIRPTVEYVY